MKDKAFLIVLSALFTALIAVGAVFSIPMPPPFLPITLAVFFCLFAGLMLGPVWGLASAALYLALGAIGLPVFANGAGGIGQFAGPSGGFLIGYAAAAFTAGIVPNKKKTLLVSLAAALLGLLALYAVGLPWFRAGISKPDKPVSLWKACVIMAPYFAGDIVKAVVAALLAKALYPLLENYKKK